MTVRSSRLGLPDHLGWELDLIDFERLVNFIRPNVCGKIRVVDLTGFDSDRSLHSPFAAQRTHQPDEEMLARRRTLLASACCRDTRLPEIEWLGRDS